MPPSTMRVRMEGWISKFTLPIISSARRYPVPSCCFSWSIEDSINSKDEPCSLFHFFFLCEISYIFNAICVAE